MSEPFLGEIRIFSFNFAPRGWAFCNGQIMSIAQNTALFSLLGTTYGGDGRTTFALPNLQSRVPLHFGHGAGLSSYSLGEQGGQETVTLATGQMPSHSHQAMGSTAGGSADSPAGAVMAQASRLNIYGSPQSLTPMAAQAVGAAGGNQPHENRPPYLALNFCIALQGIFPSRS